MLSRLCWVKGRCVKGPHMAFEPQPVVESHENADTEDRTFLGGGWTGPKGTWLHPVCAAAL